MIEQICPKCNVPMRGERCANPKCNSPLEMSTTIYWCPQCGVPIFFDKCPVCGSKGKYIATDIRPVFPQEKLLLAILLGKVNPLCYENASVWFGSGKYIIDGESLHLSVTEINHKSLSDIHSLKEKYDQFEPQIDYERFQVIADRFVLANQDRYLEINEEAVNFILKYKDRYSIEDMFVSFSGGKDSTVTSHLVTKALGTNKILHIFGDTTLEFPLTYTYKQRFRRNEESRGIQILTAKNREKDFFELCDVLGPPSRVMRWCCTVFKTGAISRTINAAFKDKTDILTFYGIRRSESKSRSKYERESESPKIAKQTTVSPILHWIDFDVWLYILTTGIDFNDAYKLGFSRVGCWCCPNNGQWSEFLAKVHMYDQYKAWHDQLIRFAKAIGKPDAENYIDTGMWKARQGGNGIEMAQKSVLNFAPCATEENTFNYELQRPIEQALYQLFKPFGYLNFELGNRRLGEVYVLDLSGEPVLRIKGRAGSKELKVGILKSLPGCRSISASEGKIQCQLTKYQMCINCKACEGVCRHGAIIITEDDQGVHYNINDQMCIRCGECVAHFNVGCYMRKVLTIKRG